MGQYFKAVLKRADSPELTLVSPRTFECFSKLTESAWVSNPFVCAVLQQCSEAPHRVAWVGDYANSDIESREEVNLGNGFVTDEESFKAIFKTAWPDGPNSPRPLPYCDLDKSVDTFDLEYIYDETTKKSRITRDYWIVNGTKKLVIHMKDYVAENVDSDGWCVDPLPILTAIGNGWGGGDYGGINTNVVGSWAFDEIFVSEEDPRNYLLYRDLETFLPHFTEMV